MEGVRRIIISLDDEKIYMRRAPLEFVGFKKLLKDLRLVIGDEIDVKIGQKKGKVSDQKSYEEWIEMSRYQGLIVNFDTYVEGENGSDYENENLKSQSQPAGKRKHRTNAKATKTPRRRTNKAAESACSGEKKTGENQSKGIKRRRSVSRKSADGDQEGLPIKRHKTGRSTEKRLEVSDGSETNSQLTGSAVKKNKSKLPQKSFENSAYIKPTDIPIAKTKRLAAPEKKTPSSRSSRRPFQKTAPQKYIQTQLKPSSNSSNSPIKPVPLPSVQSYSSFSSSGSGLFSAPIPTSSSGFFSTPASIPTPNAPNFLTPSKPSNFSTNQSGLFSTPPTKSLFGSKGLQPLSTPQTASTLADVNSTPHHLQNSASPIAPSLRFPPSNPDLDGNSFTDITPGLFQFSKKPFSLDSSYGIITAEGVLDLYDPVNKTKRKQYCITFKRSSRFLNTNEGILVTGGSGAPYQAFLVTKDFEIKPIVSMTHARFWHSMGFIDKHPAVAVGAETSANPRKYIKSVEIYKDGNWVQYPSANLERASSILVSHEKYSYLVGGVITDGVKNSIVNSIEQWNGTEWVELKVQLSLPLISPGCFCISEVEIMVFGGETQGAAYVDAVYILDVLSGEITECNALRKKTKFSYEQVRKCGEILKALDSQGEFHEIPLVSMIDE